VSWSDNEHQGGITRPRDDATEWRADTDTVGPVTPELTDSVLAHGGEINSEVTMSSEHLTPLQSSPTLDEASSVSEGSVPAADEHASVAGPTDMRDVPLGTLVFRAGLLSQDRLEEALQEGVKTGRRLGEILVERGWVSDSDLGRLLAGQKGLPFVELEAITIDPAATPLLEPEKARLHGALPIGFEDGVPVVAVGDPSNQLVIENVRRALGLEPRFVVAGREALGRAIDQVYGRMVDLIVEPQPVQAESAAVQEPELTWTVVLRLADGERIEVGAYDAETQAMEAAQNAVAELAAGSTWPFVGGRYLRPDTIVSVDVVQREVDRWLGSSLRAAAWSGQPPS
jgi:hypothetical protein